MIGSTIPTNVKKYIRNSLVRTGGNVGEVILIIDMINDFLHEKGALYSDRHRALVPAMKEFLTKKYDNGACLIFCCDAHIKGDEERYPAHALAGTTGAEVIDEFKSLVNKERSFLLHKRSPDAFLGTFLQTILEFLDPKKNYSGWSMH